MGTLTLTLLFGASILLVAKFFPGSGNNGFDKPSSDQDPISDSTSTVASDLVPILTVAVVLITIWTMLTLATTYPVVFVAVFLILAVGVCLTYRIWHPGLDYRNLFRKLFSDLWPLTIKVRDDFWTSFVWLRAWQRERAARIERERAAAQERQAQERARLERIERERRARRYNEHLTVGEYEDIQRGLQRERATAACGEDGTGTKDI